jgi:ribulose-5-phosphate 4-epimerase/fuculose-1-phosphate aldolase
MFDRNQESQINSLLEMSARIGGDPLLVQAGTGNTSIKLDGTLWIKASGKWLAHAKRDDWLVPVDLEEARNCLRQNVDIDGEYMSPAGNNLRPSVETAMHSVIPDRVVIHVHSVSTIAWAVRRDGPAQVGDLLAGLMWRWIPYVPSGNGLAREIEKAIAQSPGTRIFILANHGSVVCGESPEAAEALLFEVEERVAIRPRLAPAPDSVDLARLAQGPDGVCPISRTSTLSVQMQSHGRSFRVEYFIPARRSSSAPMFPSCTASPRLKPLMLAPRDALRPLCSQLSKASA